MNATTFVIVALQLGTMLAAALVLGQLMRRWKQPVVLGEMIGGIVVGPTIFGAVFPEIYQWLFNSSPPANLIRDSAIKLGMLFFLYIAGSEIDLADVRRTGTRALSIGLTGTILPILMGVGLVYLLPEGFWGDTAVGHRFAFALFIGMNLANSANPVLARILMDIGLLRTRIGTLAMSATMVDDLINWALFAVILGGMADASGEVAAGRGPWSTVAMVLMLYVLVLVGLRQVANRVLPWIRTRLGGPSAFISLVAMLILGVAAVAEGAGVHAFLGAFLVGVALGGHRRDQESANHVIAQFSVSFFAPIYFVSMGMTTDFVANFDLVLVLVITAVAFVAKLGSVLIGARISRMPIDRTTWAIGFGLNARGATGIIIAGVGLQAGIIDERIFVAVVVMALVTSLIAGPAMSHLLKPVVPHLAGATPKTDDASQTQSPSIRRVLLPVRPGRPNPTTDEPSVELRLLDGFGPKLQVTLLAVGSESNSVQLNQFLDDLASRYPGRSIETKLAFDSDPAEAILRESADHDLVIVGAPRGEESRDWQGRLDTERHLGRVIARILAEAECPTMVMWRHLLPERLDRILIPGDDTRRTEVATDLAFALAEGTSATVTMLQVVQSAGYAQYFDEAAGVAERAMHLRRPGVPFETRIVQSAEAATTIREVARQIGADLMVLSTRSYVEAATEIVGATAFDLLAYPPCPLALVHVPSDET